MDKPLVSIITPCYNGERYLDRYFASILHQTYPNLELIFINDGSTDRTEEIAQGYRLPLEQRGIRYTYLSQENAGQAAALNRGLKLFTGEYLTWPDADDEMTSDCIEKKVAYLQAHPELQMVRSDGIYQNQDTGEKRYIAKEFDKLTQCIFNDLLIVKTYGCCGCYMITRNILLECYPECGFFESRVGQNWQILVPVSSRSYCGYIDEPLYIVHEHGDSHSRKSKTVQQMYQWWEMFTDVLRHALKASQCDYKNSLKLIEENNARQQFYYAVSARDRAGLKRTMKALRAYGKPTTKESLLYVKCMLGG